MDTVSDPPTFSRDGGATSPLLASALRSIEELHSELEFEWLRPWGVQGKLHAETHASYWAPRIGKLHAVWLRLEARTAAHLAFLAAAAADGVDNKKAAKALPEGVRCFDVLLQHFATRLQPPTTARARAPAAIPLGGHARVQGFPGH